MGQPVPPENVRLVDPLGNEWPCEVTYEGFVGGVHRWRAVPTHISAEFGPGWKVMVSTLPAGTEVSVSMES